MFIRSNRAAESGASALELTLVSMVMLSILLGMVEIGRGVWIFHSLSESVKSAARYAAVRGSACRDSSVGCAPSVGEIVERIRLASRDLEPERFAVTLEVGSQQVRCVTLSACAADPAYWPTSSNVDEGRTLTIKGHYTFDTLLFSLIFGADPQTGFRLSSESSERISF